MIGWVVPHYGDHAFISPHEYGDPNIICHADAFPAPFHAPVAPGDTIELQWTPWDISHVGPIMDYLANCHGPCENATKADLRFFKIDEKGLVPGPGQPNGINRMASDDLRAAGSKWEVKIPSGIKPGFYVLRHEMMALHFAENPDGAQNYPNCINLEITGSGTLDPPGIPAVSMYHPTDPGVSIDIKTSLTTYQIPGPPLFDGSAAPDSVGNNGSSSGSVPAPPSPLASLPSSSAAAAQTSPSPTSTSTLDVVAAGSGSCAASAETVTTVVMVTEVSISPFLFSVNHMYQLRGTY